jgi:adducin
MLKMCKEEIVIGEVSKKNYIGGMFEKEEREKIERNLGKLKKVMLIENNGEVCCGEKVEEEFLNV